jgi:hypothetical protein
MLALCVGSLVGCGRINYDALPDQTGSDAMKDGAVSGADVLTDYFSDCEIDTTLWELVDPLSDGTFVANGSGFEISIAGTSEGHDIYSFPDDPDSFQYTVPRAIQPIADIDFEVEAKFDSSLTPEFQQQGIVVQQDLENVLRVEFHSNGTNTRLYIAHIVDRTTTTVLNEAVASLGVAPMYLRVKRTGSRWDVTHSFDGTAFTQLPAASFDQTYNISNIGVFAGNGPMVAHTAVVDYLWNLSEPFDSAAAMPTTCP